jgi:hypothetical protein
LFISYVGNEYQEAKKLRETNDGNVRKDTEHLEVNTKSELLKFIFIFSKGNDQK